MSKFSFTDSSGKIFEVVGPPGATVEQAREIFNQQVNTGSLVGLVPGDVVDAETQVAGGLTAAVSQLSPRTSTRSTSLDLSDVPLLAPVNTAEFVQQRPPTFGLGPLGPSQLQGLIAQSAASTGQSADQISADRGVGKFGLDINRLESTGYLKPGTAIAFDKTAPSPTNQHDIDEAARINAAGGVTTPDQVAKNRQLNSFLSPAAFTGKAGVSNLQDVLADESVQNRIQGDVFKQSYQGLVQTGLTNQLQDPKKLSGVLQTAVTFGLGTAEKFAKGQTVANISQVKVVAKAAEYAKSFADKFAGFLSSGSPLETGIRRPRGSTNTVNRTTVDASITNILGNPKIPSPKFVPSRDNK